MISPLVLLLACILDLILADPYAWPHPVKAMGAYIRAFENGLRVHLRSESSKKLLGFILLVSLLLITAILSGLGLYLAHRWHPFLHFILSVYLAYTCLSARGLAMEANKVVQVGEKLGLEAARKQVSHIVGRQTDELSQEQVYAATIETVAENTSDGVLAPLFYLTLFGPIGGLLYKAINTLDSMVAYRTEKYKSFGYAAAKLDDWANCLPARLTAFYMLLAGQCLGMDTRYAISICKRDARKHLSPNAGYSEAAMAGLLKIQVGGSHHYSGQVIVKPRIGEDKYPITAEKVRQAIQLLYLTSFLFLVSLLFLLWIVHS